MSCVLHFGLLTNGIQRMHSATKLRNFPISWKNFVSDCKRRTQTEDVCQRSVDTNILTKNKFLEREWRILRHAELYNL